ncbi:PAS domain-containing protein [Mucilaginibacter robiniae]|uniref:PAS domain-containing protein n=1 Tax=Mucilaginibacter robiniae TaxID=2728022 RepID=A0A7L5DXC1_9SPHI|nr:GAF domain-containing protein [Mucilaginibacter robiniae]QJD95675.1 PAS domain-containing protein [Mucilaginibacter robiniae]
MSFKELERLQVVNRFIKLDFCKEKELQAIVEMAADVCQTPIALITLIDDQTQYIKFKVGTDVAKTSRHNSFCSQAIEQYQTFMVPDALQDKRFENNPLVTNAPHLRFYAGAPLTTHDGYNLGSLCVLDYVPKQLSEQQLLMLQILSKQVINLMELDASLKILKEQFVKVKNSEIQLKAFFESSSSCHILIGRDLKTVAFNRAAATAVKHFHHIDLAIGMLAINFIHKDNLYNFIYSYQQAIQGISVQAEQHLRYQEEDRWWHITYDPACNADGEIIGISYNATDITQRVEQEQKVTKQNASLEQIAYIQSHELRRPVASIMGLMNLFKMEDYTTTKEELQMMEKAVEELDEKIKLIVNHAR